MQETNSVDCFAQSQKERKLKMSKEVKSIEKEFDNASVGRLVLKLGLPAMLAQFFNILYSIVDRIYIGHMPSGADMALASIGVCSPAFTAITGFASLVGVGGAALMSISLGQKNAKAAQKALNNSLMMLVILSIIVTVILLLVKRPLLYLLGCSDAMYPYVSAYYTIYSFGTAAVLCGTGMNRFIMGQGYARHGMMSVVIGAVLNIILDPVFIFVLDMGIAGAAWATIISQFGVLLYVFIVLGSKKMPIRLGFGGYDMSVCLRTLVIGSMSFLIIFLDNFLIILLNAMLRKYGGALGDSYISYAAVVQSVCVIAVCPAEGITSGCATLFSYYYGAGNSKRVRKSFYYVLLVCGIYLGLITLATQLAPELFVRLFISDAQAVAQTAEFVKRYNLGLTMVAVQFAFVDGFTAMGMVKEAIPISFFRKGLYVVAVLVLPMLFPLEYIFYVGSIADIVGSLFTIAMYFLVLNPRLEKLMKVEKEKIIT